MKRELTLDSALLRKGSIFYAPTTDQVKIELTVSTPGGSASDSLIVILPSTGASRLAARALEANSGRERGQTGFGEQRGPTRPFALPAAPQTTGTGASLTALDEPPPVQASNDVVTTALPVIVPQLPAPPPVRAAGEQQFNVGQPDNSGSVSKSALPPAQLYEPPAIARRVTPSYPPSLKNVVVAPTTVQVKVGIDESGNAVTVDAVPQEKPAPPLIVKSALDAARMWKFKPARRNNKTIPSEMILEFRFRPNQY